MRNRRASARRRRAPRHRRRPRSSGPAPRSSRSIAIPEGTGGLTIGEGAVWALSWSKWTLMRIDPHKNVITARIKVKPTNPCPPAPDTCGQVAAGNGAVWVSMRTDNVVARVDPKTSKVTAMIPVGKEPDGIATSPGAVWVANHGDRHQRPQRLPHRSGDEPGGGDDLGRTDDRLLLGPHGSDPGCRIRLGHRPQRKCPRENRRGDERGHGDDHVDEAGGSTLRRCRRQRQLPSGSRALTAEVSSGRSIRARTGRPAAGSTAARLRSTSVSPSARSG